MLSHDLEYRLWAKYIDKICKTTQTKQFLNCCFCFLWWFWRETGNNSNQIHMFRSPPGAIYESICHLQPIGGGGRHIRGAIAIPETLQYLFLELSCFIVFDYGFLVRSRSFPKRSPRLYLVKIGSYIIILVPKKPRGLYLGQKILPAVF